MDIVIQRVECSKCGHAWIPRTINVRRCPRCQTLDFLKGAVINCDKEIDKPEEA